MGEDPDRIRAQIEQTRTEMEGTVDALGYKADVKTRAKESLQDSRDSAKESVMEATRTVRDKLVGVGDATPDREQVKHQARQVKGLAQENPVGLALGAVAVGFVAGLLIPATRVEDEKLGDASDQVIEKVKETGQEALERGKQVAEETAHSAQETFKDSAQHHGQAVRETAEANAHQAAQQATPSPY